MAREWYAQAIEFCGQLLWRVQRNTSDTSGNVLMGVFDMNMAEQFCISLNYRGSTPLGFKIRKGVKF